MASKLTIESIFRLSGIDNFKLPDAKKENKMVMSAKGFPRQMCSICIELKLFLV